MLYLAIFVTGLCSLGYQTVWQKYLSVLVGSEARSTTIIVAIFLLGLALGYFVFGRYSETIKNRKQLLKNYGFIELATGAYAILFPSLFNLVFNSSIAQYNNLALHIFLTFLILIFPTMLMGATIPIMTAVLPEKHDDINSVHSFIYGLNTLGAFLGVIVTVGYLINQFGFNLTLINLGFVNVLVALVYIGNNLKGEVNEKDSIVIVENNYSTPAIYALSLVVGAVSICLEMLWIRITGLTIGSGYFVFGLVLSIFILGIGLGSLSLRKLSPRDFRNLLVKTAVFITLPFFAVPYLPLLISNLRVLFISHEYVYYLFHGLVYIIFLVLLMPGVFYLGRILPYAFSMVNKNSDDYSFKCGVIYFLNTIGTFLGAVVLGYMLFYVFQIEGIYRFCLALLFVTFSYFLIKAKSYKSLTVLAIVLAFVFTLPFPRRFHEKALFRLKKPEKIHFKNIFKVANEKSNRGIVFFEDGPNTTVTVKSFVQDGSKAVLVNGKSDGDTLADYGTTMLAAMLPYSKVKGEKLDVAVVGIGTGISPGVLTTLPRVDSIDVLEISNSILNSIKFLEPENYGFHKHDKVKIFNLDAFQFFKSEKKKDYEIILSEPSNPWVWGVENLYTSYFYSVAKKTMAPEGVFVQWLHTYSLSDEIFVTIIKNLRKNFKHINLYHTLVGDIVLLATDDIDSAVIKSRDNEKAFMSALQTMTFDKTEQLKYLSVYNHREIDTIIATNQTFEHSIFAPLLSYKAYKEFFLGNRATSSQFLSPYYSRLINRGDLNSHKDGAFDYIRNLSCIKGQKPESARAHLPCSILKRLYGGTIDNYLGKDLEKRIVAYSILRKEKILQLDESFLEDSLKEQREIAKEDRKRATKLFGFLVEELNKEGLFNRSEELIKLELKSGRLSKEVAEELLAAIELRKKNLKMVFSKL
jgi:predicted membrane-bound spermidine synthase